MPLHWFSSGFFLRPFGAGGLPESSTFHYRGKKPPLQAKPSFPLASPSILAARWRRHNGQTGPAAKKFGILCSASNGFSLFFAILSPSSQRKNPLSTLSKARIMSAVARIVKPEGLPPSESSRTVQGCGGRFVSITGANRRRAGRARPIQRRKGKAICLNLGGTAEHASLRP